MDSLPASESSTPLMQSVIAAPNTSAAEADPAFLRDDLTLSAILLPDSAVYAPVSAFNGQSQHLSDHWAGPAPGAIAASVHAQPSAADHYSLQL